MKKQMYVAPVTRRFSVELEGGFTSASVVTNDPKSDVTSTGQEINEIDFGGEDCKEWNDGSGWE